jgi:hypothetical protein
MGKSGSFVQNVNVVKEGIFQLSHSGKDHVDGYGQQNANIKQSSTNLSPNFTFIENSAPSANLSH